MTDPDERRPSPDALLAQAKAEAHGKLKIYLGAAPGVGKTFEMLSDARKKLADGVDIVAGVVETHGRKETLALCEGIELIPKHKLGYRGRELEEMDLDALLARRPQIALVDELAHTNVEGSRHPKRWMDVEELLAAGIDVWTTLNIQHLESLNDIVARITRVRVRETVPDAVLERADEIELIDLTPEELIERLKEGKVYAPDQAQRAIRNYFAPGNLSALRELAMRRAADRIDQQVRGLRQAQGESAPWAAGDRILVCVDERPDAAEVVRHAKRIADRAKAQWVAVYVQTERYTRLSETERGRISETLRLATRLGADTATLPGDRVAESILAYAREQNITQIVVGKAKRPFLFEAMFGSVVRELIDQAETIAIYVVPEEGDGARKRRLVSPIPKPAISFQSALESVALTAAAVGAAFPLDRYIGVSNLTLVFLAAVLISALARGLWSGLLTGILCALAYNWFYTEPRYTFTVADPENVLAIIAFSGAAILVSFLASRAREQTQSARAEARTSRELFGLAKGLASVASEDEVAQTLAAYTARAFDAECAVFARQGVSDLRLAGCAPAAVTIAEPDMAAARWTAAKGQAAGRGADTLPGARWLFVPMRTARLFSGVLAIARDKTLSPAERRRLDAMADQAATALERAHIARAYEEGRVEMEAERLRATMLASLSHDLKTPIAGILGAASSLRTYGDKHDEGTRAELLAGIEAEAERMQRYVVKLLDMTRLESGGVKQKVEPLDAADVVAAVLKRAAPLAEGIWIDGDVSPGLPLLRADATLLHQTLFNLVENAIVHGARQTDGGEVRLAARMADGGIVFTVTDNGPGLPAGAENRIFERFFRGDQNPASGTGLGLAIVKGFAELMGAKIEAHNQRGHRGAVFTLAFPESATA
ncbi:MAG: sensor histidine kinase KdpD [Hydrogenophilaceae bacterium]|jgi:two-component system sensor histidine kinase KdpD|nr:sensor histidine kinase KdpD [Hydrogenophilaceae bacterium]